MASVTFFPQGTQLDNDEIADLQVKAGDGLKFSTILDTSGLDADLQSIKIRLESDSTEFSPSETFTDFFETTFPNVAIVEDNSDGDFASAVLELNGEPGAIPNTANILVESEATFLSGLVNDGETDIGVTVVEAIDANGNDVTDLFEPASQALDLQPSPQVQAVFGTEKSEPIIGTTQNDIIRGKEGNDIIIDSEGNDTDFGGEGNDVFLDDTGDDTIIGGAGDDFVTIDSVDSGGDELIDLGTGNDFAFGGTGADTFVLNRDSGATGIGDFTPGEDRFALGENLTKDDLNFAQLDNDGLGSLNGSTLISDADKKLIAFVNSAPVKDVSNAEFINAEEVLPTDDSSTTEESSPEPIQAELPPSQSGEIFGTPDPDILVGDDGTNLILTGGDSSFVNAGGGDDLVFGEENLNIFNGEAGDDLLSGGVSENDALGDFFSGGEGADTLLGQRGNDVLNGDDGNDLLVGGSGIIDALNGGRGDDLLFGGAGNDVLFGNEGHDTFAFASGEEADIIFDFELGRDAIALTSGFSYDSLQIEYNAQGNYTNISDETGELIATLIGVEADQLTESNFTTVTPTPDETTIDETPELQPNQILESDLTVQVDYVGTMPFELGSNALGEPAPNLGSPVSIENQLYLIDQNDAIYRSNGNNNPQIQQVFNIDEAPAELTLDGSESILNIAPGSDPNSIYVMFTSDTEPTADIPVYRLPDPLPEIVGLEEEAVDDLYNVQTLPESVSFYEPSEKGYQVLYEYKLAGSGLTEPRPIAAFETQVGPTTHSGGGMLTLADGRILFATGDGLPLGTDGRSAPQDPTEHVGKLLIIDPDDGSFEVAAQGVRNVQHMELVPSDDPENTLVAFTNIGGVTAEEVNYVSLDELLDTSTIENFGWGRNSDGLAREGTFYIEPGVPLVLGTSPPASSSAPSPEPGFIQPQAQYGRNDPNGGLAISGPVTSTSSFDEITGLFGDLSSGIVYATTDSYTEIDSDVFRVNLIDENGTPLDSLQDLAGGRADPRFFQFPDGSAGVLLEATGDFYQLSEVDTTGDFV